MQTIYLMVAMLALLTACFLPLYRYEKGAQTVAVGLLWEQVTSGTDNISSHTQEARSWRRVRQEPIPAIGIALGLALLGYSTFSYTRRPRQMRICNAAFSLVVMVLILIYSASPEEKVSYQSGAYAILVALVGILLARLYIRKDERLVRAAERLR